ncbi:ISL3 family transposase [Streptomyces sp. NPDC020794]|uniref:ISL3 family transposase n=1 Tax=unclassified Streptomyces TaxID=2593676 RepID=UPI0036E9B0A2
MEALVGGTLVQLSSTRSSRACPDCGVASRRVHSRYGRQLDDCPIAGRPVWVRLTVRRFFCDTPTCPRRTFVEQIDGVSEPYQRASSGLRFVLRSVAAEMGGRPGARLCRKLSVPAGRMRLLGHLLAPAVPDRAPRVLGVDEFAFRRGRSYGTILVDVETHQLVDVLPDRSSETLAAWLRDHVGAEVVCRDRASAYTRAVKEAAPDATEVADRWHLLRNLSLAVERVCHEHRACLQKYAEQQQQAQPRHPTLDLVPTTLIVDRVRRRHEVINRMVDTGYPISEIARRLALDRKTVRRYRDTNFDVLLASARDRRNVPLDRFKPYLQVQFAAGHANAKELYDQICERGFSGGYSTLSRYVRTLRDGTAVPAPAPVPSPRTISGWIMQPRERLSPRQAAELERVRLACPDITEACNLARAFTDLVRSRRGHLLTEWIRQGERCGQPSIRSFASFLRQDLHAVTAGLTLAYSSGVVEGHVCRVKLLKRSMYGRASFTLLRTRILTRT